MAIVTAVVEKNWPSALIHKGGPAEAIDFLRSGAIPQALLLDFSKSKNAEEDAKIIKDLAPAMTLIGLGAVNDVVLFRKLLAAGCSDYLIKPLAHDTFEQAIISAAHFSVAEEKKSGEGDLIVIVGSRGGVGASTIAVNLAWILAEENRFSVSLADLDIHFGTAALALDIEPSPGLREALKNPSRIDSLFVTSALVKATERLYVMGSEEPLDEEILPDPEAMGLLLSELRRRFRFVLVDLPRNMIRLQDTILASATKIVVVSDISLAGIRDTVRLLTKIKQVATKPSIKIVANKFNNITAGLAVKDFERGTDTKIDIVVPEDVKIAVAANAGKPVASVSGGLSSASKALIEYRNLAALITGKSAPAAKKQASSLLSILKKK